MFLPRPLDDDVDDTDHLYDWDNHVPKPKKVGFWTDDRITVLRQLWNLGVVTREIALALGTTKNAVIGKADRLGLPRREQKNQQSPRRKKRRGKGFKLRQKRKR